MEWWRMKADQVKKIQAMIPINMCVVRIPCFPKVESNSVYFIEIK